ncbi:MAG: universal stress protein [Deltaproteobacteria bacterium]|nr:universal stress protein [Deltaproteobacteria bacterium]
MKLQKILVPTDFSEFATAALDYAAFLAGPGSIELHILHVLELDGGAPYSLRSVMPDLEEHFESIEQKATDAMKSLLDDHRADAVIIHRVLRRAFAAGPAIIEYAQEEEIDLIVMGTHGRRGLRRFLLGSVAEEVVKTAPCSVLTLREQPEGGRGGLGKMLVPFDFSSDSERALEVAKELAVAYGSERIEVLHVAPVPAAAMGSGLPVAVPVHLPMAEQAREVLREYDSAGSPGKPQIVTRVLEGPAAMRLVEEAEAIGTDLIVLGSHGLTGLRRFLMGSVSERVVRWADCPVLVLRSTSEEALASVETARAES